jgi:hypothetical protein
MKHDAATGHAELVAAKRNDVVGPRTPKRVFMRVGTRFRERPFVAFAFTDPTACSQGLARACMQAVMSELAARGESELGLVVTLANLPAVHLYTRSASSAKREPGTSMNHLVAALTATLFVVLSLWHFYMAGRPMSGESAAVPSAGGKPLFVPSKRSTLAVGIVLALFAGLVATTAGFVSVGLPQVILVWLSYALAAGLLLRAIGEFKYLGFFKRVRDSQFARMDTWVYSPLCLLLAAGVGHTAWRGGS